MAKSYEVIANTTEISHEQWLKIRKEYIGGSDAGSIIGINPYSSAATVWLDKQSDEIKNIDNERMRIGRDLEDYVAKRFEEETGKKVRKNNNMMVSKKYPFMLANIDRAIVGENAILECKTTGSYSKKDWLDGNVPPHYYTQVQHYIAVLDAEKAYIAVLIGNEAFVWYEIERDDEYIEELIQAEKQFYEVNMLAGGFPTPDGSNAYSEALKSRFPKAEQGEIELEKSNSFLEHYENLKASIDRLEKEKKNIEQRIQLELSDHESGYTDDYIVTWKNVNSNRFDKKSFEKDYPDLVNEYTKQSRSRRFQVKRKKD